MERKIFRTQFPALGFEHVTHGLWRIVDREGNAHIGPHYPSKQTLLADLARFAADFGCNK